MNDTLEVFGDVTVINRDRIFESLIEPWEHDHLVEVCLGVILPALGELCKRLVFRPSPRWKVGKCH